MTHVETAGHGTIRDVHYTIVLAFGGEGVVCRTCTVSKDVGSILD